MRRYVPCFYASVASALLGLLGACTPAAAPAGAAAPTPAAAFIMQTVRFEQRHAGRVLWQGEGETAEGDVRCAEVGRLRLRRLPPPDSRQEPVEVLASHGVLRFAQGTATFTAMVMHHPHLGALHAPLADYSEADQCLRASGPVVWQSSRGTLHAQGGTVYLHDARADLDGPVHGVLEATKSPTP